MPSIALALVILISSIFTDGVTSFSTAFVSFSSSPNCLPRYSSAIAVLRFSKNQDSADSDDDATFYRELQEAKKNLGAALPEDQLRESAVSAEQEFLRAMQQSKEQYEQAKAQEDLSASDFFLRKIKEEEEAEERRQKSADDTNDEEGFQ